MKEYFKNKLLVLVVITCTGTSEGNGKTLSLTLMYLKSLLDLQQIAGAALCHLLVVGSSGCEISLNQRALGLKPIPSGPTALAKLLPVTRTLAELDTLCLDLEVPLDGNHCSTSLQAHGPYHLSPAEDLALSRSSL